MIFSGVHKYDLYKYNWKLVQNLKQKNEIDNQNRSDFNLIADLIREWLHHYYAPPSNINWLTRENVADFLMQHILWI